MAFLRKLFFIIYFFSVSSIAVNVVDDNNQIITLSEPVHRIISTAPHITEFLYDIGAGEKIVGVTEYSNYPSQAKKYPQVGNHRFIDIEKVLTLKPDLVIVWKSGSPIRQIEKIERMGIPVFYSDIQNLSDFATTFERLGILVGEEEKGREKAKLWKERLTKLYQQYQNKKTLKVFYQVSENPLYTLSGRYIVSEGMQLCGGKNIFSDSSLIAPRINFEEVIKRNPDVIFVSENIGNPKGLEFWNRFETIEAVKKQNLFKVNPDLLERPGPRFLDGLIILCEKLETARLGEKAISQ